MKEETYDDIRKAFRALALWDELMEFCENRTMISVKEIKYFYDLIENKQDKEVENG